MSFVSVVARKNFLTVVSDGKVTGADGSTIQNDYQKFKVIGRDSFIAFAGTQHVCEMIIDNCTEVFKTLNNDFSLWKLYLTEVFTQTNLAEIYNTHGYKAILAFGGQSNNNKIEFHTVHSKDSIFQEYKPVLESDIKYAFLYSGQSGTNPNDLLIPLLKEAGVDSANQFLTAQRKLNHSMSLVDDHVNDTTFELNINRT